MAKLTKSDILKKALIEAMVKTLGIVTSACEKCNCSRETFYKYYKEDKEFKKQIDDVSNIALDFAESKLHKLIQNENPTGIIFYLKTKGKSRGYIERVETDLKISDNDGFDKAQKIIDDMKKNKPKNKP